MKIIAKSNFDDESFSEYVIADDVSHYWGERIVQALRTVMREDEQLYPMLVKNDHELYKWEP